MKTGKFISLYSKFTPKQRKSFYLFVKSPYFNSNLTLIDFLKEIEVVLFDLNSELNPIAIYNKIFNNTDYNSSKWRLILSQLFALAEEFIALELSKDQELKPLFLTHYYRSSHLQKLFDQSIHEIKENLENSSIRNDHFYDYQYDISQEIYEWQVTNRRQEDYQMDKILDYIEIPYYIKKLKHSCRCNTLKTIHKMEINFPFLSDITTHIDTNELYKIPVLGFYYFTHLSQLQSGNEAYFQKALYILFNHENEFSHQELKENYITSLNYCIRKANLGQQNYLELLFDIYKRCLDKDYLIEFGSMSRFTYRNIAENGLKLKEFSWVKHFLESNKKFIEIKYRNSIYLLELARWNSEQKYFNEALNILNNLSFNDVLLELACRLERIKIFFEIKEIDLASYQLQSMDTFMRRKNQFGYHSEHYKKFVSYCNKLFKINIYEPQQIKSLYSQINSEDKFTERKWLLDKCTELMN
jgi:hypothetical protein